MVLLLESLPEGATDSEPDPNMTIADKAALNKTGELNAAFQPANTGGNARLRDTIAPLADVGVARWNINRNTITYQRDDSHTLSLYVSGGESSYRKDQRDRKGAPGTLCLMPQGHESRWHINGEIEFVHLYFTDQMLKNYAAAHFKTDVRFIELRDLIYQQDPTLYRLFQAYASIGDGAALVSPLRAEEIICQLMHHLILHYNGFKVRAQVIKGGLSPQHMSRVSTMVQDCLAQKLSLEKLSDAVNLSPFHFARMFKHSFGESPAVYITRQRINQVKRELQSNLSLAEVSTLVGFSQQSHMTKNFKKITGMTPGEYRKKL
jgi:AraC family transcriptional regulator